MAETPDIIRIDSGKPGPRLLVFGAIHGNEPCGPRGTRQVAELFETGRAKLQAGSLTMVPVCNPRAFEKNERFIEKNLNRVFKRHVAPAKYEEELANTLTPLVDDCDYLLDLHSQSSNGAPFVFQDYDDARTKALAHAVGAATVLTGWPEMYAERADLNDGDTVGYAHAHGKTAILLECGQYLDPQGPATAQSAILNSLVHLGMATAPVPVPAADTASRVIRGRKIYSVPEAGGTLVQDWQHLQPVAAGQALAIAAGGEPILAPYDGVIVLPKNKAKAGEEWFYLGTPEP